MVTALFTAGMFPAAASAWRLYDALCAARSGAAVRGGFLFRENAGAAIRGAVNRAAPETPEGLRRAAGRVC